MEGFVVFNWEKIAKRSWKPRLLNLVRLRKLCHKEGVAFYPVPADGNCLAWSLRMLLMGIPHCEKASQGDEKREMRTVRQMMKNLWIAHKDSETWQVIFKCLCHDFIKSCEKPPPPKPVSVKKEPNLHAKPMIDGSARVDLLTPPRPELPKNKKRGVQFVGKREPAPGFKRKEEDAITETQFKLPGPLQKPQAPDPEKSLLVDNQLIPHQNFQEEEKEKEKDELELSDDEPLRKKRYVHRSCKRRIPSSAEKLQNLLTNFLASLGITYLDFLNRHREKGGCRKAENCKNGGFVCFKQILMDKNFKEKLTDCETCDLIIEEFRITTEMVEGAIAKANEPEAEAASDEDVKEPAEKKEKLSEDEERAKCLEYLKQHADEIEVICLPKNKLAYKCLICRSRTQPEGKVNQLGLARIANVEHSLKQHLASSTHLKNRSEVSRRNLPETDHAAGGQAVSCRGYLVGSEETHGSLYLYEEEFKLWMHYSSLDVQSVHKYWCNFSEGHAFIKHKNCTNRPRPRSLACPPCLQLGEARSIQRQVLRFISKYYAALLLNRRLFHAQEETERLVEQISQTSWATRQQSWSELLAMSNSQLQSWVRKSFQTIPNDLKSEKLTVFVQTTVEPCLKVHVSTIDNKMLTLFSQFATAVGKNELSVPWREL